MAKYNVELEVCRSDMGDGGWSLHAVDSGFVSEDEVLLSGPAEWDDYGGVWDRPNEVDWHIAENELKKRMADEIDMNDVETVRDKAEAEGDERMRQICQWAIDENNGWRDGAADCWHNCALEIVEDRISDGV